MHELPHLLEGELEELASAGAARGRSASPPVARAAANGHERSNGRPLTPVG